MELQLRDASGRVAAYKDFQPSEAPWAQAQYVRQELVFELKGIAPGDYEMALLPWDCMTCRLPGEPYVMRMGTIKVGGGK